MTTDIPARIIVPARWRIVGWIMLTVVVVLVAMIALTRNLLLVDVDRNANLNVTQEIEEFRTFAANGVDPTTSQPFTSVARMLEIYVDRQHPGESEQLLAIVGQRTHRAVGEMPMDTGVAGTVLTDNPEMLDRILSSPSNSGVEDIGTGKLRWGRVEVIAGDGESGNFLVANYTAAGRDRVAETVRTIGTVALVGIALTALIGWLVAGRILAPIRQVRLVAEGIGDNDLTSRVPARGRDDVAALARTFNAMLDRLENTWEVQRRFVDDAGHELRTPITVIRGHFDLLNLGAVDEDERADTMRLIDDELGRMGRIVNDLLTLAKVEQPNFVQCAPADVPALTLDIESKAQMLGDRQWQLMEVAEGSAHVDAQRVTQAVLQLASNAVSHTRAGDTIQLGSSYVDRDAERMLRLWVRDTGPGVPPEDIEQIFERFNRGQHVAAGNRPDRPGAGLGLSIVRAIADAHHGVAWVTSVPGEGATFGIDLPVDDLSDSTRRDETP